MKIAIFNTLEQATEYFDRDYTELFARIEIEDIRNLTMDNHTPKQREDGKYYYPTLDSADYVGIEIGDIEVPQPTQSEELVETPTEEQE